MTASELQEFDVLASAYCDNGLDSAALAALERAITESPVLRRRFLEMTALHASLTRTPETAEPLPAAPRRRSWRYTAIAFAVAASVLGVLVLRPPAVPNVANPTTVHARLSEFEGAEVIGPDGRPGQAVVGLVVAPGYSVRTGDGGRAVLLYENGTRVDVGAASAAAVATWTGDGPDGQSMVLEYGVVHATAQPGSSPLVVTTQHAVIRMLAATLICTASPDATRVEVLTGLANVVRRSDGQAIELVAGRSAVASRDPAEPLLTRLNGRAAIPRFDVRTSGRAFALAPDGKRLATASRDKLIVWDGQTGKEEFSLPTSGRHVGATMFAPDGRTLAAVRDNDTITTWDLATRTVRSDDATPSGPKVLAFSADSKWLAVGCEVTGSPAIVRVNPVSPGTPGKTLATEDVSVLGLAFAPNGKELAAGTPSRGLVVWNLVAGTERAALRWDFRRRDRVDPIVYSPDGRWLAGGFTHRSAIRVWDAVNLTEKTTLSGQGRVFRSVAFSPNGRQVAAGTLDGTLFIWDVDTGEEKLCDKLDNRPVRFLVYSADGATLTTITESGLVQRWSVERK